METPEERDFLLHEGVEFMQGYLPRAANRAVAAEMDCGGRVEARIAYLGPPGNPWARVGIDMYLVP